MAVRRMIRLVLLPFKIGYHLPRSKQGALHPRDNRPNEEDLTDSGLERSQGCLNRLRSRLKFPSCCQGDGQPPRQGNRKFYQDGYISSLVVFILFIAASFSVSLCYWVTSGQSVKVQFHVNQSLLIAYMMLACLIMWSLCSYQSKTLHFLHKYVIEKPSAQQQRQQPNTTGAGTVTKETTSGASRRTTVPSNVSDMGLGQLIARKFRKNLQDAIPLVGMFVFFAIGIFMDVILIIANGTCLKAFHDCNMALEYSISVAFHVCRIVFQASGLAFTFRFHKKAFRQCALIRYSLLFILAATTSNWFDSLLFQSHEIFGEHNPYMSYCNIENTAVTITTTTKSPSVAATSLYDKLVFYTQVTNVTQCINLKTPLFEINNQISMYLYPLHIEYALLVCEIVFHLYFNVVPSNADITEHTGGEQNALEGAVLIDTEAERDRVTSWLATTVDAATRVKEVGGACGGTEETGEWDDDVSGSLDEPFPLLVNSGTGFHRSGSISSRHSRQLSDGQAGSGNRRTSVTRDNQDTEATITSSRARLQPQHQPGCNPKPKHNPRGMGGIPKLFAMTMVLNIVFITMAGLTYLDNFDDDEGFDGKTDTNANTFDWRYRYAICTLIVHMSVILTIVVGLCASEGTKSRFKLYSGLDLLILTSTLGLFLKAGLAMIGALAFSQGSEKEGNLTSILGYVASEGRPKVPDGMPRAIITSQAVHILEVFLQATFCMHAGRIKFKKTQNCRRLLMKEVVFFLAVTNLTMWFLSSFIEVKNRQVSPILTYYYGDELWEWVIQALMPFILFYRFNTFLILMSTYFDH